MLDHQLGLIQFRCDDCGEVLDAGTSYMPAAAEYLGEQKWRAVRVSEYVWKHYCPECRMSAAKLRGKGNR